MQSATYTVGHDQADGHPWVKFDFVLDDGSTMRLHRKVYDKTAIALNAMQDALAAIIEAERADDEYAEAVSIVAPLKLHYLNATTFAARVREEYRNSSRERLYYLSWWLVEMITTGYLTNAQVRDAFGMDASTYSTFMNTKVVPRHDSWAAVLLAQGE